MFVCYLKKSYHFLPNRCTTMRGKKAREIIYSLTLEPHFIIFVCSNFFLSQSWRKHLLNFEQKHITKHLPLFSS